MKQKWPVKRFSRSFGFDQNELLVKERAILAHTAHFDFGLVLGEHFLVGGHQLLLVSRKNGPLPFHADHFLRLVTT